MRIARSLVIVLACLALQGMGGCGRSKLEQLPPASGEGVPPPPDLPVVGASNGATSVATSEGRTTGTTYPRAEAQIGPNGAGVIAKIFVKEGDPVRRGMVLFRQDTGDAELRVAQAQAAIESARVNFRATETEYQRTKSMYEQKAVNQMQWDQTQARFDSARVGVQQAQVSLNMARKSLTDATVRSPLSGVVVSKLKSEGEMATMMPPTVILIVQDQSTLELRFRLPERAMSDVRVGDEIEATFEAVALKRQARVVRIQPSVDTRTRTVEAVAELPNADGALKSGLLASVHLGAESRAATVPVQPTTPKAVARREPRKVEAAP